MNLKVRSLGQQVIKKDGGFSSHGITGIITKLTK